MEHGEFFPRVGLGTLPRFDGVGRQRFGHHFCFCLFQLPDGTEYEDCVQTLDWVPLEPDALEYEFYAPGVGLVLERSVDGEEEASLVEN